VLLPGLPHVVPASESDASSVPEGAQLYEADSATEVPRGLRARESHESRQPITSDVWQVSTRVNSSHVYGLLLLFVWHITIK
jgi:hypothetical protein